MICDALTVCGIYSIECGRKELDMRTSILVISLLALSGCFESDGPSVAPELINKVISGPIEGIPEGSERKWGDGVNHLCTYWSLAGFFYGTMDTSSSVDVAVLNRPDILKVIDAESLQFTRDNVYAVPGQTVVFRGRNGFFGAWKIDDITPEGMLIGTWYFRSGGSGDFTADLVEIDAVPEWPGAGGCLNTS